MAGARSPVSALVSRAGVADDAECWCAVSSTYRPKCSRPAKASSRRSRHRSADHTNWCHPACIPRPRSRPPPPRPPASAKPAPALFFPAAHKRKSQPSFCSSAGICCFRLPPTAHASTTGPAPRRPPRRSPSASICPKGTTLWPTRQDKPGSPPGFSGSPRACPGRWFRHNPAPQSAMRRNAHHHLHIMLNSRAGSSGQTSAPAIAESSPSRLALLGGIHPRGRVHRAAGPAAALPGH